MVHRNYDAKDLAYRVHNSDLKQLSAKSVDEHKEVSSVYYLYVWIIVVQVKAQLVINRATKKKVSPHTVKSKGSGKQYHITCFNF